MMPTVPGARATSLHAFVGALGRSALSRRALARGVVAAVRHAWDEGGARVLAEQGALGPALAEGERPVGADEVEGLLAAVERWTLGVPVDLAEFAWRSEEVELVAAALEARWRAMDPQGSSFGLVNARLSLGFATPEVLALVTALLAVQAVRLAAHLAWSKGAPSYNERPDVPWPNPRLDALHHAATLLWALGARDERGRTTEADAEIMGIVRAALAAAPPPPLAASTLGRFLRGTG